MAKQPGGSKRGVPRRASSKSRKQKYQTYALVKQPRLDEKRIRHLMRHNGMTLEQAQAFWMRQKGRTVST